MMSLARPLCAALALCLTTSCASAGNEAWVELKGKRFNVEIADEEPERQRGLMFRDEMPADDGMFFIHDELAPQAYWMKNTKIPLDILYFDDSLRLVSAQQRVPPCSMGDRCPPFPSEGPARYVLELNAGLAEQLGVKPGDQLILGPAVPKPK